MFLLKYTTNKKLSVSFPVGSFLKALLKSREQKPLTLCSGWLQNSIKVFGNKAFIIAN